MVSANISSPGTDPVPASGQSCKLEPDETPTWLAAAFVGHKWQSLRSCSLRVGSEGGAGLDLEACDFGYLVDAVEATPGQEPSLSAGSVVIAIDGVQLFGLEEEAMEAAFGSRFCDAARLMLADADELRKAKASAAAPAAEMLEVGGLVMQSLPPRKRRRQRAADGNNGGDSGVPEECDDDGQPAETTEDQISRCLKEKEIRQFEFMDHTADVILHSWGRTLTEAFSQVCVAFFSYMTELDTIDMVTSVEVEAKGHDMLDMLYHLLDEFLFHFGSTYVILRRVEILELDETNLRVRARGFGERFDLSKHPQGTEIKAITMHQMKILTETTLMTEDGSVLRKESAMEGGSGKLGFPFECYVLVDI